MRQNSRNIIETKEKKSIFGHALDIFRYVSFIIVLI